MKRLLVTSDDFGMCHAINDGTVRAMREGIVRSTNLMAPCPWFQEAAQLSRQHELPTGVHLTVTCEWDLYRWRPLTNARGLCAEDGGMPRSHERLALTATTDELRAEFVAQIEAVERAGLRITHLDTHMLPPGAGAPHALRVQALARELAERLAVPFTYEWRDERSLHFRDMLEISTFDEEAIWGKLATWSEPGDYALSGHAACAAEELRHLDSRDEAWSERYRVRDLAFFTATATLERLTAQGFTLVGIGELFR